MYLYDDETKLNDIESILEALDRIVPPLKNARYLASCSYSKKATEFWAKIVKLQGVANELITEVEKEVHDRRIKLYGPDEEEE